MDIKIIKYLISKKLISPATGRLLETAFICGATYLLGAVVQGELISINGLFVAIVTPIYLYISKTQRDIK